MLPLRVVRRVGAVVEGTGAFGESAESDGVGSIRGGGRDTRDGGAAAGDEDDLGAAVGEEAGDVGTDGAGPDDDVTIGH